VAAAGVRTERQALVHILLLASLRGLIVRGPMIGREQAYVLVTDWLGTPAAVDRDRALAELARRFLAGHGPASDRDLAKWAGVSLRDARAGLDAIRSQLAPREDGLLDLARRPARDRGALPRPRLLGAFEPLLLGWVDRDQVVGEKWRRLVAGGVFRPFALVGGKAAGTWQIARGEVVLEPFGPLTRDVRSALDADAEDVLRFLSR
jgi:hypothetical protein